MIEERPDYRLNLLIDLVKSDQERPLFSSAIEEPLLFRKFIKPYILIGIQAKEKLRNVAP